MVSPKDDPYDLVVTNGSCTAVAVLRMAPGRSYTAHLFVGEFWNLSDVGKRVVGGPPPVSPAAVQSSPYNFARDTPIVPRTVVTVSIP